MRIRPIARDDLDGLQALAQQAGVGFTSLPDNREFLAGKIDAAARAFEERTPVDDRLYFLYWKMSPTASWQAAAPLKVRWGARCRSTTTGLAPWPTLRYSSTCIAPSTRCF